MTTVPWLLNTRALGQGSSKAFALDAILHTGHAARTGLADLGEMALGDQTALLPLVMRESWLCVLALEFLLAEAIARAPLPSESWSLLDDLHPFGYEGPTVLQLRHHPCAVSVIPLRRDDHPSPGAAAVWLFTDPTGALRQKEHRHLFSSGESFFTTESDSAIFLRTSTGTNNITGASWQLGATLAAKALRENHCIETLASEWLATGELSTDQRVQRVGIGNKILLPTARNWLLPAGNLGDLPLNWRPRGDVRTPSDLGSAWNLVTATGVVDAGKSTWPEDPAALHSFVSTGHGPLVAAVLLSQAQRVVLWQTDNVEASRLPAKGITEVLLPGIRPDLVKDGKVLVDDVVSNNLLQIESKLMAGLKKDLATRRPVLFNITQGNRLMAMAVYNIAMLHPNLWMVYRDNDATGLDFTALRIEGRNPRSTTLTGDGGVAKVRWDNLLRSARPPTPTNWEDVLREILVQE